ncbi:hypothetical protein GBA52_029069 [Prunus armeniaca]|nr:hypothetical protein GBA52_029069 [Prunus armeniaca]
MGLIVGFRLQMWPYDWTSSVADLNPKPSRLRTTPTPSTGYIYFSIDDESCYCRTTSHSLIVIHSRPRRTGEWHVERVDFMTTIRIRGGHHSEPRNAGLKIARVGAQCTRNT